VTFLAVSQQNTEIVLSDHARKYLINSKSASTRKAYRSDFKHFTAFCESQHVLPIPAAPATVAAYLVMLAEAGRKTATMSRRLAAISKAHSTAQLDSPASTKHAVVKEVWAGIRRTIGTAQTTKAAATTDYLKLMLAHVPSTLTGFRDRALILLCFAGGMRRSEVVALTVQDAVYVPEGLVVTIRGSKTDQERAGQKVAVALGKNADTCPVRSLRAWLLKGGIASGPLFRGVNRWGTVQTEALTDQVVALLVKKYARLAGLDACLFSGHSLRAGLATSASKIVGVDERIIMKQTRHKSEAMVRRYIRDGSLFSQNISGMVGL
jgi:site-specific recombinase XerD